MLQLHGQRDQVPLHRHEVQPGQDVLGDQGLARTARAPHPALLALALPATASADNRITIVSGEAAFTSEDPGIANEFIVEDVNPTEIRFAESKDPYGINAPPQCRPGQTIQAPNNGGAVPIEVFCPRSQITKGITIDAGPAEDNVRYDVDAITGIVAGGTGTDVVASVKATNDYLSGDQGNDTVDAGAGNDEVRGEDGNDTLKGGDGNDKLFGGTGADAIDAGAGDDTIESNDGVADRVVCGPGNDAVIADTADELIDCENADRRVVAPPSDQPVGDDKTRPKLQAGGSSSQRVTRKRRFIRIAATSSEKGLVQAAGFVEAGGVNLRVKPTSKAVKVAGGGVTLKIVFSKSQIKRILRDLRRGRRVSVRMTVSSVDAAGNTSRARHFRVRLRR